MTTTAPEAALLSALAAYIQAQFAATSDLAQSAVVEEWPEPTDPLTLAQNRVVVAVIRGGPSRTDERLGGPNVERVTPGTGATGVVRVEAGAIEQPITIGLWAWRRALRDDVDAFLGEILNRPMFDTIAPVANTTLAVATTKAGEQLVTPASMDDIWPGCTLEVGTGATLERVVVKDIRPTGFIAPPRYAHAAGETLVEVAGRKELAAAGLHLRCADHFGNVGRFLFEDGVQTMDDAENGRGSQRQEWRSMRRGIGSLRWTRSISGVVLQRHLDIEVHASTTGGVVSNPTEIPVF